MIDTRVCIDDILGPYDAKISPKGPIVPRFTLDTVRQLAADTQTVANKHGWDETETVHVINAGPDGENSPRVTVLLIQWWQLYDEGQEHSAHVIVPDGDGLYSAAENWSWAIHVWWCACGNDNKWHVLDCSVCDLTRDTQPEKPAQS